MDDEAVRLELRKRLIEAEFALKEAEKEYELYVKELDNYKKDISDQKEIILRIKSRIDILVQ